MSDAPPPGQVGAGHPQTSHDAADLARWAALDNRELILLRLLKNGDKGATSQELAAELGISTNIAGARLIELRAEKSCADSWPRLVQKNGKRRALPGQRPCDVHVLNDQGRAAAERLFARMGNRWPMTMRSEGE